LLPPAEAVNTTDGLAQVILPDDVTLTVGNGETVMVEVAVEVQVPTAALTV